MTDYYDIKVFERFLFKSVLAGTSNVFRFSYSNGIFTHHEKLTFEGLVSIFLTDIFI